MRRTPTPPFERDRIVVDVSLLREVEAYLGDLPAADKRAGDLHDLIVRALASQGVL